MPLSITAVILGGGRGSRLYPLTKDRCKPAVTLAGKYRLIDIAISNCINSGIRNIYVLTQFNSVSLNRHVNQAYRFDQFTRGFGVAVLAAEQTEASGDWFQGTADAVRQSCQRLADVGSEYVLILSGDHLYSMDYHDFLNSHRDNNAQISVAVQPVLPADAPDLGILKINSHGRITDFVEKPSGEALRQMAVDTTTLGLSPEEARKRPYLGSMGIYLFNWDVLNEILTTDTTSVDFGKEVIPQAISCRPVYAYLFDGYWADIGTIRAFFDANLDFCNVLPKLNLFDPKRPIYSNQRFLPPAKTCGGILEECLLADGCIIDGGIIRRSILGLRSRVFADVNIHEMVMMGADNYESAAMAAGDEPRIGIGEGTVMRRVIIDKNAAIGKGVRLVNLEGHQHYDDPEGRFNVRDGIIVVPRKAVIPHGFSF